MDCAGNELIQDGRCLAIDFCSAGGRCLGVEIIAHVSNPTRFSSASARAQPSEKGEELEDYIEKLPIRFTTIGLMIGDWSMESGDW
jgi:hypothetical protein